MTQSIRSTCLFSVLLPGLLMSATARTVAAADGLLEVVEVVGMTPLNPGKGAQFNVIQFDAESLARAQDYSIAGFLERRIAGITVNDAQNNPLQPDVRYRGFSASPLLGSSPGLVVYYNGVRVNENFGDTVNWDLLPLDSLDSVSLVSGSDAVYGQNALGGAIVLTGKNGFFPAGGSMAASTGSSGQRQRQFEAGGNNDVWGYRVMGQTFAEDGWRDYSPTRARFAYGAISRRTDRSELDLFLNLGDSELHGNGASPEGLLERDRSAVFTHPDITRNQMQMVTLAYRHWLGEASVVSTNIYHRHIDTRSFNGDGSEAQACALPRDAWLCDEDGDQVVSTTGEFVGSHFDAINNRSEREQESWGASGQIYLQREWNGFTQHLTIGGDYLRGDTDFHSSTEFASLTETRATTGSGLYDPDGHTALGARTETAGLFLQNLLALNSRLELQASLRYNRVGISSRDHSGARPELDASHHYSRLNGGLGASYQVRDSLSVHARAHQASRAPTQVELACSHPEAPCTLPNTFLADPPLDDVVSRSLEAGLRGAMGVLSEWRLDAFWTVNSDDIHFQSTGGSASNQGYFANIGNTVHRGIDASATLAYQRWNLSAGYSFLDATYGDGFSAATPNHPQAEGGRLWVAPGKQLPGLPRHSARLRLEYRHDDRWRGGVELLAASGVYLRGDEANVDRQLAGFAIANVQASFEFRAGFSLQAQVNNIFDHQYERFGLYGDADEVLPELSDDGARFLSPARPRNYLLTLSYNW